MRQHKQRTNKNAARRNVVTMPIDTCVMIYLFGMETSDLKTPCYV